MAAISFIINYSLNHFNDKLTVVKNDHMDSVWLLPRALYLPRSQTQHGGDVIFC